MVGLPCQRNEVQPQCSCDSLSADATVRVTAPYEARRRKMSFGNPIVALHRCSGNPGLAQQVVQQPTASCSRFTVGKPHIFAREIGNAGYSLRVALGSNESFIPNGVQNDGHGVSAKQLGEGL